MNDDTTINRHSIRRAYQQVADAITARITTGHYTIKLPSELPWPKNSASPTSPSGTQPRSSENSA